MDELSLSRYWDDIPNGKENAVTYSDLIFKWGKKARDIRQILHELSRYDNGDDYILIRSGSVKGFYKTDETAAIEAYKRECLNKGRSIFAPVKKINRVLCANDVQITFENNLRLYREKAGLKQRAVCKMMHNADRNFNVPLLSKMENGVCMPTMKQIAKLADIYGCSASDLIVADLF